MRLTHAQALVLGNRTVLGCVVDVHSGTTGSYCRHPQAQTEDVQLLKEILAGWEPSLERYEKFDNAVKTLIEIAVEEAEACAGSVVDS